jgi:hypothetical protein
MQINERDEQPSHARLTIRDSFEQVSNMTDGEGISDVHNNEGGSILDPHEQAVILSEDGRVGPRRTKTKPRDSLAARLLRSAGETPS